MLKIFNSFTNRKEKFKKSSNKVGVYVCGITPYDITHLGHAFLYTSFDVFLRYMRHLGYKTKYVQNVTDIDDDIIKKAKEEKKNWKKLGNENAAKFLADMKWLNNKSPDVYPKATEHIKEIINITKGLLKRGLAYEKNGSVYFSQKKFKGYGSLSKFSEKKRLKIANERGNDPNDPNKEDVLDFVLWQATKQGEPFWDSPWGSGRPGWHIECSAMSTKYLGDTIDIHGGGFDLIFPHHESEIAQSEGYSKKKFVNFWMHAGMLYYQGEKMSKSLGNLVLISDLKKKYTANVIRMYILSHHYRSVFEYFEKDLKKIQKTEKLFKKVSLKKIKKRESLDIKKYEKDFYTAMDDDFNTPKALKILTKLAQKILDSEKDITKAKGFMQKAYDIFGLVI